MQLLQTQKNSIFDLIERSNHSPSQSQFLDLTNLSPELTLQYKGTSFIFNFDGGVNVTYICSFSLGYNSYRTKYDKLKWNEVTKLISDWFKFVTAEINAPDNWS